MAHTSTVLPFLAFELTPRAPIIPIRSFLITIKSTAFIFLLVCICSSYRIKLLPCSSSDKINTCPFKALVYPPKRLIYFQGQFKNVSAISAPFVEELFFLH